MTKNNWLLPLGLITASMTIAVYLYLSKPLPKRAKPKKNSILVNIVKLQSETRTVLVEATGTVIPAQKVLLQPEVSGRIIEISPRLLPGGRMSQGEVVCRIDPRDYQYKMEQAQAGLQKAEFELKLEIGRSEVAKCEWELLEDSISSTGQGKELMLRKPHLQNAKAALRAARSRIAQAKLDLNRATITAPFACLILDKNAEVGQLLSSQSRITTLVGTDYYWVQATLPVSELGWLKLPDHKNKQSSAATIICKTGTNKNLVRQGKLLKLLGDLEGSGRMARILIEIKDPLNMANKLPTSQSLLLGLYVKVILQGKKIENIFVIPRTALHEDKQVWLMNKTGKLEVRTINIAWRTNSEIFINSGLAAGENLIISNIATPIPGISLHLNQSGNTAGKGKSEAAK